LTSLQLKCPGLEFTAAGTHSWASLPALKKLSLAQCSVHADALAAFTQLQALSVDEVKRTSSLEGLLLAVSGLTQLTELCIKIEQLGVSSPPSAACTALTVGTKLCALQLAIAKHPGTTIPAGCDLFTPGTVYPACALSTLRVLVTMTLHSSGCLLASSSCSSCAAAALLWRILLSV
jgi:hypothetical protein